MRTIMWSERGTVKMYDQRKLPLEVVIVEFDDYRDVARSIQDMYIRGAPTEIAGSFPEKERPILSIIEGLRELVGDGNEAAV